MIPIRRQVRGHEKCPHILDELLQVRRKLFLIFLDVEVDIVAHRRLELVSLARFIVIRTRQSGRSLVRQELVKHAHPLRHGIFENFGQLLAIQTIEDSANQPQALQQLTRELNIRPARV